MPLNPLVHSVLFKGRCNKPDVKNVIQYSNEKNILGLFQSPEVTTEQHVLFVTVLLATELTTFYLENKSHALMD